MARRQNKFMEVADDLAAKIAGMSPGDALPTVEALKAQYEITGATASRAIRELRDRGLIHSKPGAGSCVARNCRHEFLVLVEPCAANHLTRHWLLFLNCMISGCARAGRNLTVLTVPPQQLMAELTQLAERSQPVAGVIFFRDYPAYEQNWPYLRGGAIPVVFFGSSSLEPHLECPGCFYDENSIIACAVTHLTAGGHRKIGCFGAAENRLDALRLKFFRQEMARGGWEEGACCFDPGCDFSEWLSRLGNDAAQREVFRDFLRGISALLVLHDAQAVQILQLLPRLGFVVPDDISVVGIDNLDFDELMLPPLTSVDLQIAEHAPRCLELLADPAAAPIFTPARLVERASAKPRKGEL